MQLADPLSRYLETVLAEFGISLEEAAKRSLETAHHSKVLKAFLEKGARREDMDAFLCLSIMIHEFRRNLCSVQEQSAGCYRLQSMVLNHDLFYLKTIVRHATMNSFGSDRTKEKAEDEYTIIAEMTAPSIVRFLDEQIVFRRELNGFQFRYWLESHGKQHTWKT
jgi:hypothetical protein